MNSMTGYGRSKLEKDTREYIVEIKSVNHRYSDINIKLPRELSFLEDKVKKVISKSVSRGKIDVYITYNDFGISGKNIFINKELAKKYIEDLNELAKENNIKNNIEAIEIAKLPDILQIQNLDTENDFIWLELKECLENAIKNFKEMREKEGNQINIDFKLRISKIKNKVDEISKISTGLVEEYIVKLNKRIKELLQMDVVDETRLATEIVIYSDKCSIEEELTRLKSHIIQFETLIDTKEPIGKKLDFLIQEMNRETNTIASKSVKLEITNYAIDIKTELEDIREQIQNIE